MQYLCHFCVFLFDCDGKEWMEKRERLKGEWVRLKPVFILPLEDSKETERQTSKRKQGMRPYGVNPH